MDMVTPRIEILEDGAIYGKFVVEPLDQGFGYTIGNALRRVLLSSITGAAVTSIKIQGVQHQFSTIPGVKEDTTELILNLRELYTRMDYEPPGDEPMTVNIDVHGPGEVTGADIKCPPSVKIVNPELHIATLDSETAGLIAELTVERGKGYVLPEKQERVKSTIGVIPIGAVFTPVLKVSYTVDPTRVGHKTDYDRLVLEVWTNGTVMPSDAVSEAARILDKQLRLFISFSGGALPGGDFDDTRTFADSMIPAIRVEELDFSVRTNNCLKKENVLWLADLAKYSEDELMNVRNFGRKSLDEVAEKLESLGLSLRESVGGEPKPQAAYSDDDDEILDDDEYENDEADDAEEADELAKEVIEE